MPAGSARPLRLPRDRRIKYGRDFARIRSQGRRLIHGCMIVNWQELPGDQPSRVGVVTNRKLGGAVIRTRARRLLREVFRLHQRTLRRPVDMVLVARASVVGKKLAQVEQDFITVLKRANLIGEAV